MKKITTLFNEAFDIYKAKFSILAGVVAPVFILTLITSLIQPHGTDLFSSLGGIFIELVGLATLILNIFMGVALILTIDGQVNNATDAYKRSVDFFLKYLILTVIMTVIVSIGYLLLIIPGIIVTIWLAFASFVLILEKQPVVDSLKKSKAYVEGIWWDVFMRLAAMTLAICVAVLLISIVTDMLPMSMFAATFFQDFVSLLIAPFAVIYVYLLYKDVKSFKGDKVNIDSEVKTEVVVEETEGNN